MTSLLFPSLAPSEHPTITAGRFPHVQKRSTGGRSGRIRLANVQLDAEIQLAFTNVDTQLLLQLYTHWTLTRGRTYDFALPAVLFQSMNASTKARLMATAWRFKDQPKVVDICGGVPGRLLHTIEITLRSQPRRVLSPVNQNNPDLSLPVAPKTAPGARLAVNATWTGGAAGVDTINAPGAQMSIRVAFGGGAASAAGSTNAPGAAWNVSTALASVGRITPAANWDVRVVLIPGKAGIEGLAPGAALNATASFSGGAASVPPQVVPGAALAVTAAWSGGTGAITGGAAPGAALNVGASWIGGRVQGITPSAAWAVSVAWIGGAGTLQGAAPGRDWPVSVAWVGGGAASADPDFASVSLLLPLNGANNSTTFTDASGNALVPSSVNGNARISTAQSKYGGASAFFDSAGDWIQYTPQELLRFPGDFTIELWMWQDILVDKILGSSTSDNNTQVFRVNQSASGNLSFFLNGTQVFNPTPAGITAGNWHHLALCRINSSTRMFVDGVQKGATNTSWTGPFRMDVIGTFFFGGTRFDGFDFNGHMDDLRISKVGRYAANFTPPGPHPTS